MVSKIVKLGMLILMVGLSLLTRSGGRGVCRQCGHNAELHACKHCGFTACLACWQRLSRNNTCPSCKVGSP